jgi:hypothetical protein
LHTLLPPHVLRGSELRGNEYGWNISSFPDALASAKTSGYACLGGQFQFRLKDGSTCEMYWMNADSVDRRQREPWTDYSCRSCLEVLARFQHLVSGADFKKEAAKWPSVQIDPAANLVFVAYFVTAAELRELSHNSVQ